MISVPIICRRRISPTEGGYHTEGISPVLQGTDIIEKRLLCLETKESFFFGAVEGTSFFVPVVACVPRWRTPCTLKAGVLKMRHWRIFWLRHHTLQVPFKIKPKTKPPLWDGFVLVRSKGLEPIRSPIRTSSVRVCLFRHDRITKLLYKLLFCLSISIFAKSLYNKKAAPLGTALI